MRLRLVTSQVVKGLSRNFAMTVAVVIVTFVSLVFVGAALLLQTQIDKLKDDWYDRVEVSIYMCPSGTSTSPSCATGEATAEQIEDIGELLGSAALQPYVERVYLETKEEAYEAFVEMMPDSTLTQSLTPDQMQVSYRVKLVDPEQYQVVADEVSGRDGVESVLDQRELLEPLFLVINRATLVALGLAGVMVIAAVLLITTTIRLSAMSRRSETEIMRLVGASHLFIQLPFMIEGALAALIGALLAVGGLWAALEFFVQRWLAVDTPWVNFVDAADLWTVGPLLVIAAILLAGLSSLLALNRYTKV